jgi:hypothetical protein
MRKGHPVFVKGPLPKYRKPQPSERNPETRAKIQAKLENVLVKGYIRPGKVQSLTGYFGVPKGPSDVRMVYDASRSGLNNALWSPNFGLPTVESLLRGVEFGTWMGDIDLGEMFLNFCLDEDLHAYCGVDLTPFHSSKKGTRWERWVRCLMGLKVSPYMAIKGLLLGLEWILGDTEDQNNVFHWERVRLNLPGSPSYDPRLPWVSKVRTDMERKDSLAALLVSYVDDLRVTGVSEEQCWMIMHRGFLIHVQHTYPAITPYLKGVHLTIDGWREGRDSEGWKLLGPPLANSDSWDDASHPEINFQDRSSSAPETVLPVPRLKDDLMALSDLLSGETPPQRIIRSEAVASAGYGFGDASGTGLGSSVLVGDSLKVSQGVWGRREANLSSNFRELTNLVDTLEQGLQSGLLQNTEFFLFTENSTAEAVYYNGTSSSKILFDLALRLRKLEMAGDFHFHLVHVAGTRMIAQGTDGLSRGCLSEGIMKGDSMLSFVPLHLSPLARQPGLLPWIQEWTGQSTLQPLTPTDWYRRGQGFQGHTTTEGFWCPMELSHQATPSKSCCHLPKTSDKSLAQAPPQTSGFCV